MTADCAQELSTFSMPQRLIIGKDSRGGGKRSRNLLNRMDSKQLEWLILNLDNNDGLMLSGITPNRFVLAAAMNY